MWGTGWRGHEDDFTIRVTCCKGNFSSESMRINVNITNFGESGYVNTQEVIYLFLQLQRKNNIPDIVVFYDRGQ